MARILIVEDHQTLSQYLRLFLQSRGHEVDVAKNGREGLKLLSDKGPYRLVLTDIRMPEMGGAEMIEKLRSAQHGIPVIAMSGLPGGNEGEAIREREHFGADWHLSKPFSGEDLMVALKKCLGRDASPPGKLAA